jgi:glycosyltransferase involved in cell wall biosynthesis
VGKVLYRGVGAKMELLSIIVPHFNEPYLDATIASLKEGAEGDIEILAIEGSKGMRAAVNEGLEKAKGDYIMKTDAHCLFGKGYDKILIADCAENWLVVPRRCPLRSETWTLADNSFKDYHYLSSPTLSCSYGRGIYPVDWKEKTENNKSILIDDTMTMQGSCYVANKKYFMDHVGFLDDNPEHYGSFTGEPLEVGLKYWLGGGEMKVNKKAWYAHLFKSPRFYRQFPDLLAPKRKLHKRSNHEWGARHWLNNEEPNMIHKFEWLVEKFWPIPDWESNWKEIWEGYK